MYEMLPRQESQRVDAVPALSSAQTETEPLQDFGHLAQPATPSVTERQIDEVKQQTKDTLVRPGDDAPQTQPIYNGDYVDPAYGTPPASEMTTGG